MKRRILSTITALALIWSLCPTWAFAAEADPALCPHHPEHTAECGYVAPSGAENSAYQPQADTELSGAPCTYVCRLCPIEELISTLPDEVTADNADDVQARLDEILALYGELTEEEQDQLDLSRCYALQAALDAASAHEPLAGESVSVTVDGTTNLYADIDTAWAAAKGVGPATITLLANVSTQQMLEVGSGDDITLNSQGHTLGISGYWNACVKVTGGSFAWTGGTITTRVSTQFCFMVNGGTVQITDCTLGSGASGLHIVDGDVTVSNSTITGSTNGINVSGGTVTLNGGAFTGEGTSTNSGGLLVEGGTVTVEGGAFTDTYRNGLTVNGGTVLVRGGDFTGGRRGLSVSGGTVSVEGGSFKGTHGLYVEDGVVTLSGGAFDGTINNQNGSVGDLLKNYGADDEPHYAYYSNGALLTNILGERSLERAAYPAVTVGACAHQGFATDYGDGTHGGNACPGCGRTLPKESHTYGPDNVCTVCGAINGSVKVVKDGAVFYVSGLAEAFKDANSGAEITPLRDLTEDVTVSSGTFTLNLDGKTVNGGLRITGGGLTIKDDAGGGTVAGSAYALEITGGSLTLSGGTYSGSLGAILAEGSTRTLRDLLGGGCAYFSGGSLMADGLDGKTLTGPVTVGPCSHAFDESGACRVCGAQMIATVTSGGSSADYGSFEEAWAAAQNAPSATLKLLQSARVDGSLVLRSGADVTLEMDDNAVLTGNDSSSLITIDGTLTMKSGTVVNQSTQSGSRVFVVNGRLNFAGGTARGTSAIACLGRSVTDITGGTLESTATGGLSLSGSSIGYCLYTGAKFAGSVSISGGIFVGQSSDANICSKDGEPVSGLLAPGCAYKDKGNNKWYALSAIEASTLRGSHGIMSIDGSLKSGYLLTVEKAPVTVTGQPEDQTITYGDPCALSVTAEAGDASKPVTYAWYLDGAAVSGAAGSTFTPSGLTAGQHTVYCVATCDGCPVKSETATVTVGKRLVTPVVENTVEKVYDGTTNYSGTPPAIRLDGLVSGDSVTASAAAWTFNSADVAGANSVTASGITLSGADAGNYILASDTAVGTGVITKSRPAITFNDTYQPDKTYDGQPIANPAESDLTVTGAAYSSVAFTWYKDSVADANRLTAAPTDAGSYVVVATIPETANTETASGESVTVTISQAAGSVSITGDPSKTYDGSAVSAPAYTKSGTGAVTVEYKEQGAEDGSYTATAPSDAGSYTVRITVAADTNYTAASDTRDFTITARTAEIAWSGTDLTYNGSEQIPVATVSNKVSGDDVSVTVTGGQTNAGTYTATANALTGAAAKNYQLPTTKPTASFTIGKAAPTVTNVTVSSPATLYESTDISEITLTHGANDTLGSIALTSGQTLTNGTKEYSWTFTPDDTSNYNPITGRVSLTVTEDALESIAITTAPNKTTYTYGESFDKTGMVVTATYVSGATKDVTNEVEIRPTTLTVDTNEVVIAYGGQTAVQAITVNPKTVSDPVITLEYSTHEYTGSALVPSVVVKDGDLTIDPKEYTVTYSNNVEIGTATVTITDNPGGNYTVSGSATFTITAKPITGASISVSGQFTYTGNAHTPDPTVTLGGNTLVKDTDYTVSYANNTDAGTASVTITGKGNYSGTETESFTIDKATLTVDGDGIAKGTYGNKLSELTVDGLTTKLDGNPVGGSWKLSGDTIPNVGDTKEYTATFTPATGAGNYKPLTAQVKLEIAQADYTGTKSASTSAKFGTTATYDLTALLPEGATAGTASTASDIFEGTPAVSGKTLSFTLAGDAKSGTTGDITILVTSTNYNDFNLTITVTVTDKDVPELTVSDITVTYSGEAVPVSAIKGTAKVGNTTVSGTWSFDGKAPVNVADSGTCQVTFTPTEGEKFATVSTTIKVTINKATPSGAPKYTAISASGKTLKEAELAAPDGTFSVPGTVAWELADSTEVTANTSYQWIFTPDDADNYNTLSGSVVLWRRSTGGGYVPSTPGTGSNLPVSTGTAQGSTVTTAAPTASTQGGTAVAKVDTAMGQEIVKQAVANNSETVIIAPKITGSVTKTEVSIPAATVGQIGNQTNASLTISTPVAGVTIPNGGLGSLSSAGGTITVSAEMQGSTVELSVTANGRTVEHIPGGVTLTVPMANTTPGTVAVLVHPDGTQETVRKSVAHNGSVTIPLDGSAKLVIVDNSKQFSDVPATSWAAEAVAFASAHELFNGTGGGMFSPDAAMSRGMLAVVLHNLENNPDQPLTGIFADVDNSQWYAEGIAWAAANGIVGGYGNGQFGPNDPITREQLAVMLWRYAGSPAATNKELHFTDADEISDYALNALRWAVENGILNGYGNGQLRPGGHATRAETAQMLKNFMESQ